MTSPPVHVSLEVTHGPLLGQKRVLLPGKPLLIGRSQEADLCLAYEPSVSRKHCEIVAQPPHCQLNTLSDNITLLNGRGIRNAILQDQDEIALGTSTVMRVRIARAGQPGTFESTTTFTGMDLGPRADQARLYSEKIFANGLVRFQSASGDLGIEQVLTVLTARGNLYALVDFNKCQLPAPKGVTDTDALFDHLTTENKLENSPAILHPGNCPQFKELILKAWGQDAALCFISRLPPQEVYAQLRQSLWLDLRGKVQPQRRSLLGYCWPSVLENLLIFKSRDFVSSLMRGIDAFILESQDPPYPWQLFAPAGYDATLHELGLERAPVKK